MGLSGIGMQSMEKAHTERINIGKIDTSEEADAEETPWRAIYLSRKYGFGMKTPISNKNFP